MIGLDTNVLVRYVTQDDPKQSPLATTLIESLTTDQPGFVTTVTVVELVWVLESCYRASRDAVVDTLTQLLRTKEIVVQHAETTWKALRQFKVGSADFADCLIERSSAEAGCALVYTFDRGAAASCGMKLIG